jgi:hypothetical protein
MNREDRCESDFQRVPSFSARGSNAKPCFRCDPTIPVLLPGGQDQQPPLTVEIPGD